MGVNVLEFWYPYKLTLYLYKLALILTLPIYHDLERGHELKNNPTLIFARDYIFTCICCCI